MARLSRALQLLLIAGAGVSTFYVAAQWSQRQRADAGGIAEPMERPARETAGATASAGAPATTAAAGAAAATARAASQAAADAAALDRDAATALADRSRSIPRSAGDPFSNLSWLPPPPPPPPPAPVASLKPPEPVAPPLPFVFVGMLERNAARAEAFLAKGEALFVVGVGDTIDNNTYRVDALSADELVMTYLPMNTEQKLTLTTGLK